MAQIVGLLIAIAALLAMLPGLLRWTTLGSQQVQGTAAAQQAAIFNQAAQQYLTQQSGSLYATATATTPVVVTAANLQAAGVLPTGFSATNVYGQTWQLEVLQPTAGTLSAVTLTTGGTALKDAQAANVAQLIGAAGGFIPVNDSGAYPQPGPSLFAYGTQGAWQLQLANFTGVARGELATYLSLIDTTGQLSSNNYLYRNGVPGNPDLNTMHTPLVFAAVETLGSACSSTGAVAQDGSGVLVSCQSGAWTMVGNSSWKAPVATFAALPATSNTVGDVRLTKDTNRAYEWTGAGWSALAVDQNGNLSVPGQLTTGQLTDSGSANIAQTLTANTVVTPGNVAGMDSTGQVWAASGQFAVNNNSWGLQPNFSSGWAMVTNSGSYASAGSAIGSIHVNDVYDRASGVWLSQVASSVNSLSSQITTLQQTVTNNYNNQQSENAWLQSQINALNSNVQTLQNEFASTGSLGAATASGGPTTSVGIGARSYAQIVTVAGTVGMQGAGSSEGNLCPYQSWGSGQTVTIAATSSGGAVLAMQAANSQPPQYQTVITWPISITFVIPANQSATIALSGGQNGTGCGTFSYAAFAL